MARLVTLYSLQWGDLSLEEVCIKAKEFGYDGLELGLPITSMCGKRTRHITRESWHCWENMDCSCASPPTWWGRRSATGLMSGTKPSYRPTSGETATLRCRPARCGRADTDRPGGQGTGYRYGSGFTGSQYGTCSTHFRRNPQMIDEGYNFLPNGSHQSWTSFTG